MEWMVWWKATKRAWPQIDWTWKQPQTVIDHDLKWWEEKPANITGDAAEAVIRAMKTFSQ